MVYKPLTYTFSSSDNRNYYAINVGIEVQAMYDIKGVKNLCLQGQIKRYTQGEHCSP